MARGITNFANELSQPPWLKDFEARGRINAIFPAKLKVDEFGDDGGTLITLGAAATGGTNEVQTITINATGGTFDITSVEPGYEGEAAGLNWNDSAATVQTALEGIFGVGNVLVTLAALVYTIRYLGALAFRNVAALQTDATNLTGGAGTAAVATSTAGSAGATSLTISALPHYVRKGSIVRFSNGTTAVVSANTAAGATALPITQLSGTLVAGQLAKVARGNDKLILSGRLCGRTYAERAAFEGFGPWDENDDEAFLLLYSLDDANAEDDAEMLSHGATIAENYLPDWDNLRDAEVAYIRANYTCIVGFGG